MTFKFISISHVIEGAKAAAGRFPMAMLTAVAGTVIALALVHLEEPAFYPKILMVLALAFPLFVATVLLGEQRAWALKQKIIAGASAVAFLVLYYFWLPADIFNSQDSSVIRYILWIIGFALLITFILFLKRNQTNAISTFWHYNKVLVFSLALTALWAGAIQAGLSIALASVDFLFNVDIGENRYLELWIIIVGIFATTFFLSRIPKGIQQLQEMQTYPKELRLFSQYVLVPLVTLYFLILYAYVVRILVIWVWPEGVLAFMILGFSLLGVLTYVSLYPLRDTVSWIRKAGTIFYVALIPQVGMLFWALWFRISEYSFTEKRYFVFIFGWWLLIMAIYFLISKKKDIRIIPITIFVIALLSSFGPWGAFTVSERSQTNRLEGFLVANNLLVDGVIQKSTVEEVSFEDRKEISAAIRYLNNVHGLDGIQPWFSRDLSTFADGDTQRVVEELIGIDYVYEWQDFGSEENRRSFQLHTISSEQEPLLDISRHNYLVMLYGVSGRFAEIDNSSYQFEIDNNNSQFIVFKDEDVIAQASLQEFLSGALKLGNRPGLDRDEMKVEFENENIFFALYFTAINGEIKEDKNYQIQSINAQLLFSLKP